MRHCAVPHCPNPSATRGWCAGHYTRWLRTGDVRADEPLGGEPKAAACAVSHCPRPPYARGWCSMHHKRWLRHGDPQADRPKRGTQQRVCTVEPCSNPVDARGLCHGHYQRLLRSGEVAAGTPFRGRSSRRQCTVVSDGERCERPLYARSLCAAHYSRWHKHGDVQADIPIRGNGCLSHGYRKVCVPRELLHLTNGDTYVTEHRLVMAMHLGRPLEPDETVHHINGVRTDNRLENLELWSTAHPKGQRVEDKVEFAVEILRRYTPQLLDRNAVTGCSTTERALPRRTAPAQSGNVPPSGFEPPLPP